MVQPPADVCGPVAAVAGNLRRSMLAIERGYNFHLDPGHLFADVAAVAGGRNYAAAVGSNPRWPGSRRG